MIHHKVPEKFHSYFWDTDVSEVNVLRDAWFVVEKVVNFGTLEAMRWLVNILGENQVRDIILRNYNISTKSAKLWGAVLNFNPQECKCMRRPSHLRVFD